MLLNLLVHQPDVDVFFCRDIQFFFLILYFLLSTAPIDKRFIDAIFLVSKFSFIIAQYSKSDCVSFGQIFKRFSLKSGNVSLNLK